MINETFMLFGEEPGLEDKQAYAGTPVIQGVARGSFEAMPACADNHWRFLPALVLY